MSSIKKRTLYTSLHLFVCLCLAMTAFVQSPKQAQGQALGRYDNIKIGTAAEDNGAAASTILHYGGDLWYVIGANGNGIAQTANENSLTLLYIHSREGAVPMTQFLQGAGPAYYADSLLQQAMTSFYEQIPANERAFIVPYDLDKTLENLINPPFPTPTLVKEQYVWPLSNMEVIRQGTRPGVHKELLDYPVNWWLRSVPGAPSSVSQLPHYVKDGSVTYNVSSASQLACRPTMKVSLDKVLMLTDAVKGAGKALAAPGDGILALPSHGQQVKLTRITEGRSLTLYQPKETAGETLVFDYENAGKGENRFVSCLLEQEGSTRYYGKLASTAAADHGSVRLPLNGVTDGTYTLKVFSETIHDDKQSDVACEPVTATLVVKSGSGVLTDFTGDKDVRLQSVCGQPVAVTAGTGSAKEPFQANIRLPYQQASVTSRELQTVNAASSATLYTGSDYTQSAASVDTAAGGNTPLFIRVTSDDQKTSAHYIVSVYRREEAGLESMIQRATALWTGATVGVKNGDYPQQALDALETAIQTAEKVRQDVYADQREVDDAVAGLEEAVEVFLSRRVEVDYSALKERIRQANTVADSAVAGYGDGQYPPNAVTMLRQAIAAAQALADDDHLSQQEVDEGYNILDMAVKGFEAARVTVHKDMLEKAIRQAEEALEKAEIGDKPGQYPQKDADTLREAIDKAKMVYYNQNTSQQESIQAVKELLHALEVFWESVVPSPMPKTGDPASGWIWLVVVLSMSGVVLCRRKQLVKLRSGR